VDDLRRLGIWLFDLRIDLHSATILAVVMLGVFALTRPITSRRWARFTAAASFEIALVCALFALWQVANRLTRGHTTGGVSRGRSLWNLEHTLHLPSELSVQHLITGHPLIVRGANYYYDTAHLTLMFVFLVWLWLRHRDRYPQWRNVLVLFTGMSLLIQMISVAPPRLIGIPGLQDTAAAYGQSVYSVIGSNVADQYAAMPSIHVGWAVLIAAAVVSASPSRWRWLACLHAAATVFVVVATANHYWLDGIVAVALVALAWVGSTALARLSIRSSRVSSRGAGRGAFAYRSGETTSVNATAPR
jgi:hypothetical protein